jgi:uncharacterized protein YodC (DUF2158 family)
MNQHKTKILVGDIVRLNSGSPDLEVTACDGKEVTVQWTAVQRESFPLPCVHRV